MLRDLLLSDLARQYELAGESERRATLTGVLLHLLHPRFLPLFFCRLSRWFFLHGMSPLASLCTYANIVMFGIEITPRCEIGRGLFFPHTSGTVIGAAAIGDSATIYQGVTLGAKELDMGFDASTRPRLGNKVTVGSGAKVLGAIVVGDGVVVGANSVLLQSAAAGTVVAGVPAREVSAARASETAGR